MKLSGIFLAAFAAVASAFPVRAELVVSEVVVYGGTAAGVVASVAAARQGAKVLLLEPGKHLGGMASGGLGWTDFGQKRCIGGISREFFRRVGKKYGARDTVWYFEPHVAESVFNEMAREAGVKIRLNTRLKEVDGVNKIGAAVKRIVAENGDVFQGDVFIDATYEGDLLAQAGVSYTFGREASTQYGESLAGVTVRTEAHQLARGISARDEGGTLYPEIQATARGALGSGDKKIQAYNYRLCMTDSAAGMVPFAKPAGYDPARYALLAVHVKSLTALAKGVPPSLSNLATLSRVRGKKTDTNNKGGFSTDFIGHSWEYPDASYARRAEIWQEHKDYIQGFFYFLAHDPSIPAATRADAATWGLAKDEFTDNGNWPHQLYVRESRRMVGEYVMKQADIQKDTTKAEGVGMGSYKSDSHHVQRFVSDSGLVENEGDMQVTVSPYEIPYRILTPKRAQATNLLVPVCFSASHVSYSTLRMEPQYMILGEAAGVAAHMAFKAGVPVQEINVQALRYGLKERGGSLGSTPTVGLPGATPGGNPQASKTGMRIVIDSRGWSQMPWQRAVGVSGRSLGGPASGVLITRP